MSFFKSLGHFFKRAAPLVFAGLKASATLEPEIVAAGLGHFLAKPLEAQALVTSIVGDLIDFRAQAKAAGIVDALAIAPEQVPGLLEKIDELIALVKAHPEAPK